MPSPRNRGSLRQRAVLALQRSIGRKRASKPPDRMSTLRVAQIEAAILSLPPVTREIFVLHRFDDLSYDRIGMRLGIGADEVEAHIAAALIHLCRELDDDH